MNIAPTLSCPSWMSIYDPLEHILFADNFDSGLLGWCPLIGNYVDDLARMHPGYQPITTPMLTSLPFWETGSHGALTGNYALKIQSRPETGSQNVAIKRLTFPYFTEIKLEFWFAFKPEANEAQLLDTSVRSIGVLFDLQNDEHRIMPHLRYLNAYNGERREQWQFKEDRVPIETLSSNTVTHYHLKDEGWRDLPGGKQQLCYNEIPTKVNWQKVSVGFDVRTGRYTHFSCNDIVFDMSGHGALRLNAMPNLRGLLNIALFVESDADRRCNLFVDSIVLSAKGEK
ncbi:MAG: hypothetical protein Hens3KO_00170 [Henriciella sp.]